MSDGVWATEGFWAGGVWAAAAEGGRLAWPSEWSPGPPTGSMRSMKKARAGGRQARGMTAETDRHAKGTKSDGRKRATTRRR